jgi:hypothetical protein
MSVVVRDKKKTPARYCEIDALSFGSKEERALLTCVCLMRSDFEDCFIPFVLS